MTELLIALHHGLIARGADLLDPPSSTSFRRRNREGIPMSTSTSTAESYRSEPNRWAILALLGVDS